MFRLNELSLASSDCQSATDIQEISLSMLGLIKVVVFENNLPQTSHTVYMKESYVTFQHMVSKTQLLLRRYVFGIIH